jgi:hypothetical protein
MTPRCVRCRLALSLELAAAAAAAAAAWPIFAAWPQLLASRLALCYQPPLLCFSLIRFLFIGKPFLFQAFARWPWFAFAFPWHCLARCRENGGFPPAFSNHSPFLRGFSKAFVAPARGRGRRRTRNRRTLPDAFSHASACWRCGVRQSPCICNVGIVLLHFLLVFFFCIAHRIHKTHKTHQTEKT